MYANFDLLWIQMKTTTYVFFFEKKGGAAKVSFRFFI